MKRFILIFTILLTITSLSYAQNLQISGGNNFSAAVCDNQQVFVWGANSSGQLGITAADAPVADAYRAVPGSVLRGNVSTTTAGLVYGDLPAIRQIDAGSGAHILGLSCASQVWAWGDNTQGQLGRNNTTTSPIPQRVRRGQQAAVVDPTNDPGGIFLNNIFYVSGGNNSSLALETGTGRVLAWGQNDNGQLGDGTTVDKTTPVYVLRAAAEGGGQLTNIVQIEGGDACTYALDANGYVWSWGINDGFQLGRPGASPQTTAARVVQGDPMNNGYSATPAPTVYLSNIVQISGGDTHCLALDANGNVWSFGGDWGQGQLGRGGGAVYQNDARKVAIPGLTGYADATNEFLGNGSDGKAIYVSAGQAMSAVVMANGRVVTFGSRGLFNSGATNLATGGPINCPSPAGGLIPAGSLGDNTTGALACNHTACDQKDVAGAYSHTPVYVRTGAGAILSGITQVSDGDAWFYAISGTGQAYTWGWNRRGELGLGAGDYVDRCAAVPFTLPTGCAFSHPCPTKPNLGLDQVTCPVFSTTLNSNVAQLYTSWKYTWEYRAGTSGAWSPLGAPAGNNTTYTPANTLGQYRVTLTDNRGTVPFLCAPCPSQMDTITFTEIANPYTVDACEDASASLARFEVTAPLSSRIKWYTNAVGGVPLNPVGDSSLTWTTSFANTNTSIPGCTRALFAEDVASEQGILFPATTDAQIAATTGCATGNFNNDWDNGANPRTITLIEVTRDVELTSISLRAGSAGNSTFEVKVYANNPTGGPHCGGCTPAGNKDGRGALLGSGTLPSMAVTAGQIIEVPISLNLTGSTGTPGKYWIGVAASGVQVTNFNCSPATTAGTDLRWTTTRPDDTGQGILTAILGQRDGNTGRMGSAFNIKFQTGTGYTCGRILVCVSGTCVLPVEYLSFTAQRAGFSALLNWATATEKNSAYFIVEKSTDGEHFEAAGKVDAAGNSSSIINYTFTDNQLGSGTTYYRLAQYDIDGKVHYSEVRSVSREGIKDVKVVPNPNNGSFTVIAEGISENSYVKLVLRNALSQTVYESSSSSGAGSNVNVQHLASGIYYLEVQTEDGNFITKIVKE